MNIDDLLEMKRIGHVDGDLLVDNMRTNRLFGLKELAEENISKTMTVCEVGSYEGISSVLLSHYCKKLYCVDIFSEEKYENTFDKNIANFSNNVEKIKSLSKDALDLFEDKSLDVVYVDASHDYENALFDIANWKNKIKNNGLMSGHDYHKDCQGVIDAVNEIFGKPDKVYEDSSWIKYL